MNKIFIRNLLIMISLIALSFPCNMIVRHYAVFFSPAQFIPIIIYALLCGVSLVLMDLSNKRINAVFAGIYLVFIIINIQFFSFLAYGPAVYWFILMFGALLASLFRKETDYERRKDCEDFKI